MAGASDHRPGNILPRYLFMRHYLTLPDDDSLKETEGFASGHMQPENSDTHKEQHASGGPRGKNLAAMIDHTLLKPEATYAQINQLCQEARDYGFAAVCVNPINVRRCAELLQNSGVRVCTVIGFPLGATLLEVKVYEAQRALDDGATEIDMVINIGALKSKDNDAVALDVNSVVQAVHAAGALVKVIIEAALLTDEEKTVACQICREAGADFVKTSTGFGPGGATVHDVALMRRVVGPTMGIKAAGGIRTLRDADSLIAVGATRLGASASVKIMAEARAA
jgi:deoxyribose-phosphate aldolase